MLNRRSYSIRSARSTNSNNVENLASNSIKVAKSENKKVDESDKKEKVENRVDTNQPKINVINVNDINPESILVYHDDTKYKFTFYDINKNLIGDFNTLQIFKYINIDVDNYLTDVELSISKELIEKYLCKYDENRNIDLISHIDSPFTGNIELLTKLYVDIYKLSDYLNTELTKFEFNESELIKHNNNIFVYNLLVRILRLISSLSESDKMNKDIMIKYSSGASFKLSQLIKDEIDFKSKKMEVIINDLQRLNQIRNTLQTKIEKMEVNIVEQNNKIDMLINMLKGNKISDIAGR